MSNPTPVVLRVTQGRSADFARATPNADGSYGGIYQGTETITYTVWPADSEAAVLTYGGAPNTWINAAQTQWLISLSDAQTAALEPGLYDLEVTAPPQSGRTGVLFRGLLEVFSAAGTAAPADLVTAYYCSKLLAGLDLTSQQVEAIPDLITASSEAIRSWCNLMFTQAIYVETLPIISGRILLSQVPVNFIERLQCSPRVALCVSNGTADAAWVSPATTGDVTSGLAITGMTLNWELSGTPYSQTIPYAADETIAGLAAAISAAGNGWTAAADSVLGAWPVTEIFDGLTSKGASPADRPYGEARFHVYSQTIADAEFDPTNGQRTGMVWVGRRRGDEAMRWGPGGEILYDAAARSADDGRVLATYNGGFATIPREVQLACVELVKQQLGRLGTDLLLRGESAGEYSYEINDAQILALPTHVLQGLSRYRVTNA